MRFFPSLSLVSLALAASLGVAACSSDPPAQPTNGYNNGYPAGAYTGQQPYGTQPYNGTPGQPQPYTGQPGQPAPVGAPPPAATAPAANPFGLPFAIPGLGGATPAGTSGGTAAGGGCDPSTSAVAGPLLSPLAAQNAPGAAADGSPVCGNVQAGQALQVTVTLTPGKCYTGIAVGPGVTQIDMSLATPMPPVTLSQGSGASTAVMAGKPNCFKNLAPFPVQATFTVKATAGSGPLMGQLFSK